jgi:hypothetical protein
MFDNFGGKIDVEFRPIKMVVMNFFNIEDLGNRRISKPRKVLIRHKEFLVSGEKPDPVT